jgi:DNA-binding transcriptional ArsR family regulator
VGIVSQNSSIRTSMTNTTMTKEEAIVKILKVLKSPMMVMCLPNREEALTLAEEYGITVKELIEVWADLAMRV